MKNRKNIIQVFTRIALAIFFFLTISCTKEEPIVKENPVITWSNPTDITMGTLLSATQLNATADVAGAFLYTPKIGTSLPLGSNQDLKVDFTPTDISNYNVVSKTVKINVLSKKDPIITWSNPADIFVGTLLSANQLNAIADVPGTFVYTPPIGTSLSVGSNRDLKVDFTPTDASYFTRSKTVKINVLPKKVPVITWSNPANIFVGTLLSASQLNATANVAGTFAYTPPIGTSLNVGSNQDLKVDFTPTDTSSYITVNKTVKINVMKKDPVITWSNPADIFDGTLLSVTQLNAIADVPGTFVYTPPIGTVFYGGKNQDLKVDFTPTDLTNYNTASKTVQINVLGVIDYDGNAYYIETIGNQVWMAENLKTTHYADGTEILLVNTESTWDLLTAGSKAYCWLNDNIDNKATYGALYTWAAAMNGSVSSTNNPSGIQGVCPTGWHLPSDAEWTQLINYLGGGSVAFGKVKEVGFIALPTGYRSTNGVFNEETSIFWSATDGGAEYSNKAWSLVINQYKGGVVELDFWYKFSGYSVRCVRD